MKTLSSHIAPLHHYPFGSIVESRSWKGGIYRFGYGNHEEIDAVSGSGNTVDMGDRWLDVRLGRTLKPDSKYHLYHGISPFSYTLNNPIIFIDPDGRKVKPLNKESQEILALSLTPEESQYVKFNRNGFVKKGQLKRGAKKLENVGGNYSALLVLVSQKDVFEIEVGNTFEVKLTKDDPSETIIHKIDEIIYSSEMEDNWRDIYKAQYEYMGRNKEDYMKDHPEFSKELTPNGLKGLTLYADEPGGVGYSASGNHRVVINASLNKEDKVSTLGHELFGHSLFKALGKNHSHGGWSPKDPNYNHELETQIKNREIESKENLNMHQ